MIKQREEVPEGRSAFDPEDTPQAMLERKAVAFDFLAERRGEICGTGRTWQMNYLSLAHVDGATPLEAVEIAMLRESEARSLLADAR